METGPLKEPSTLTPGGLYGSERALNAAEARRTRMAHEALAAEHGRDQRQGSPGNGDSSGGASPGPGRASARDRSARSAQNCRTTPIRC